MSRRGIMWLLHDTWDFRSLPPATDFESFGKALLVCANGDGRIAPAERAWVLGYLEAYGCPEEVTERLATYEGHDPIERVVDSSPSMRLSARSALYDAMRACLADGELDAGERATLARMAQAVGVEEAVLDRLVEHYHDELHLRGRRLRLLYPKGNPFPG